jgi:hypothetical protein
VLIENWQNEPKWDLGEKTVGQALFSPTMAPPARSGGSCEQAGIHFTDDEAGEIGVRLLKR